MEELKHTPLQEPAERSWFEKLFVGVAPYLIVIAGLLLLGVMLQLGKTNERVAETEAYTRVTNCIVAKSGTTTRNFEDVEECYVQVEKNTGRSLERFDEQTNNEPASNQ